MEHDLTGQMLIAMPDMEDPRFARSVVYLCAHSDEGAMGLIVNKPATEVSFAEVMDQLDIAPARRADMIVHFGGPVEMARGFVLHSADYSTEGATLTVSDCVRMTATLEVLDHLARGVGPRKALFALGYAGWGPGQLESELAQNAWLTGAENEEVLFSVPAEDKWAEGLRGFGVDPALLSAEAGHA